MKRPGITIRLAFAVCLALAAPAAAVERAEIPLKYRWDLAAIFPSDQAWDQARSALSRRIDTLAAFQGRLGVSSDSFAVALTTYMDVQRELDRVFVYASMRADEDARESKPLERKSMAEQLLVQFGTATAFLRPEIIALGAERVRGYVDREPRLKDYRPWLEDVLRYAPHTLSAAEEKVAARAAIMSNSGETIRGVLTNAELPYPEVTLSSREKVRLDAQGYTRYRAAPNRADRDTVFRAFWAAHQAFKGVLGSALNAQIQAHVADRDIHRFDSCLESSLFNDNIPTEVYHQLVNDVRANLPTLHRYLKLRQRMMGVDQLRYEDLYAPIIPSVDLSYTPEQALDLTQAAVAPLGKDYVAMLRRASDERWMDWMPSTGKASGAYSTGVYGIHPYQLQNFTGLYEEVGTFAHEAGHTMHTYLSDTHQPYVTHNYATFVAEVASTLNENLLFHHMLGRTKDKPTRLFMLGSYLDNLRGTLFRQTLFAEFELRIHEMVEKGSPLSGENLTELYLGLVREYYGHDQGVCRVDDLYGIEWGYIDHFFYDFYVYQYATSIVASTALANGIHQDVTAKKKAMPHRDAYLRLLQAGSSKYPIDLLKDAGVDMTTSAPFQAAMKEMNAVMDEMEKLLR